MFTNYHHFRFFLLTDLSLIARTTLYRSVSTSFVSEAAVGGFLFTTTLVIDNLLINYGRLARCAVARRRVGRSLTGRGGFSGSVNLPNITSTRVILAGLADRVNHRRPGGIALAKSTGLSVGSLFNDRGTAVGLGLGTLPIFSGRGNTVFLGRVRIISTAMRPRGVRAIVRALLPCLGRTLHGCFGRRPTCILHRSNDRNRTVTGGLTGNVRIGPNRVIVPFASW